MSLLTVSPEKISHQKLPSSGTQESTDQRFSGRTCRWLQDVFCSIVEKISSYVNWLFVCWNPGKGKDENSLPENLNAASLTTSHSVTPHTICTPTRVEKEELEKIEEKVRVIFTSFDYIDMNITLVSEKFEFICLEGVLNDDVFSGLKALECRLIYNQLLFRFCCKNILRDLCFEKFIVKNGFDNDLSLEKFYIDTYFNINNDLTVIKDCFAYFFKFYQPPISQLTNVKKLKEKMEGFDDENDKTFFKHNEREMLKFFIGFNEREDEITQLYTEQMINFKESVLSNFNKLNIKEMDNLKNCLYLMEKDFKNDISNLSLLKKWVDIKERFDGFKNNFCFKEGFLDLFMLKAKEKFLIKNVQLDIGRQPDYGVRGCFRFQFFIDFRGSEWNKIFFERFLSEYLQSPIDGERFSREVLERVVNSFVDEKLLRHCQEMINSNKTLYCNSVKINMEDLRNMFLNGKIWCIESNGSDLFQQLDFKTAFVNHKNEIVTPINKFYRYIEIFASGFS